jgi:type VI secretion system secreted protein VgrG
VYHDDLLTVDTGNRTLQIKQGNVSETVDQGNKSLQVKTGNVDQKVDTGNKSLQVKSGNLDQKIDMGNYSTKLGMGNHSLKLDLGQSTTEAMQSITLKVGGNSIVIDQTGVTIKGIMVKIEGQATLDAKSPLTTVKADALLTLKGALTMIN